MCHYSCASYAKAVKLFHVIVDNCRQSGAGQERLHLVSTEGQSHFQTEMAHQCEVAGVCALNFLYVFMGLCSAAHGKYIAPIPVQM